jgi:transcription antitermination factor NusG
MAAFTKERVEAIGRLGMPLLPLEPFVYPADLLENPNSLGVNQGRWWVLHTRPRAEKALARRLLKHGNSFYLPLYQRRWQSRGRTFRSYVPLFPGYLMLQGDNQIRLQALETNLVVRVLPVEDQEQLQVDLARIYRMIAAGVSLQPEEQLVPGTPVEIISGPLAGLSGKVLRRGKQLKFFVEVQFLQRGVSVEIESWMIQPVVEHRLVTAVSA